VSLGQLKWFDIGKILDDLLFTWTGKSEVPVQSQEASSSKRSVPKQGNAILDFESSTRFFSNFPAFLDYQRLVTHDIFKTPHNTL